MRRRVSSIGPVTVSLKRVVLCAAFFLLLIGVSGRAVAELRKEMVPMRDGVKLATNVFLPDGKGPWPAVLTRTPYNKDGRIGGGGEQEAAPYLDRGYVRIVQDCRGRFASEGEYRAFIDDIEDGYDTIEWIAAQSWCDGKVGMIGGSAMGITANQAAISGAPHLACAVVVVAHGSAYRYATYPGGAFLQNMNEEWLKRQGVAPTDVPRPIHRTYGDADRKRDMRHYYAKITVPMINIGGWYDIFGQGNIDNFVGLQYQGAEGAKGNQKLIMGAFGHGRLQGNLKYPPDAGRQDAELSMKWFDHWLKGADNGVTKEPAVRYYVMGDTFDQRAPGNEWRTAEAWPPKSTATAYYLHADRKLSTAEPAADEGSDTFTYDPRDPVPTVGGNNLMLPLGPMDQREVSGRADVLVFQTEPLESPVEIVGRVAAELAVSTFAEDTDFCAKLVDVYPDGYEALVLDQAFRLRYHEGFEKASRVEPGKTYPIKIDLWSTALVFNRGHRIALHVTSSNSPRFEPHSNTWEPVDNYDKAVKARNTVYHHAAAVSKLVLPVTKVYANGAAAAAGNGAAGANGRAKTEADAKPKVPAGVN
ncbi:MAG: CocE/NonD family hydrolase [Planctomycetia bacterium]|nr:CocE/NonD family hydrolase [Planctomycetia bacterium]